MWDGSVVLKGFLRWVLSCRVWSELVRGLGSVGVCVLLPGRSGAVGEVAGGLFWMAVVDLVGVVLRVRESTGLRLSGC